jgi:MFS family permease|tara:strand:- start:4125 stop:5345 length:1221 start_codon:yes stop_codon:yes gene_type:complete
MTVGQMALVIILPLYILERGDGLASAALIFAMRSLGSMVVNLPASVAIARFGTRPVMLTGVAMIGAGALALSVAETNLQIALATLIFGAGMGTWLLSRLSYITRHIAIQQRGKAMSVLAGIQRLGMLIGPLAGGLGVQAFGYEAVFVLIAACAVVSALPIWFFSEAAMDKDPTGRPALRPESELVAGPKPLTNLFTLVPKILYRHQKVFLSAGVFVFCLQFVREQRRLLITLWGASLGLDADAIGFAVSLTAIVDMLVFPVAGYLMDNKGRKVSGLSCILIMAVTLSLLALTGTYTTYVLVAVLTGVGNGLGSGIMLTLGSDFAPQHDSNQFLGVWRIFCDLGSLTGPLLTSIVSSLVIALNATAIVGMLGGLALWLLVDETLPKKTSPKTASAKIQQAEPAPRDD